MTLAEEESVDLRLIDTKMPKRCLEPGDMVTHSDDMFAAGTVVASHRPGHALVVWGREPAIIARAIARNKRDLLDEIDREILNDMLRTAPSDLPEAP